MNDQSTNRSDFKQAKHFVKTGCCRRQCVKYSSYILRKQTDLIVSFGKWDEFIHFLKPPQSPDSVQSFILLRKKCSIKTSTEKINRENTSRTQSAEKVLLLQTIELHNNKVLCDAQRGYSTHQKDKRKPACFSPCGSITRAFSIHIDSQQYSAVLFLIIARAESA